MRGHRGVRQRRPLRRPGRPPRSALEEFGSNHENASELPDVSPEATPTLEWMGSAVADDVTAQATENTAATGAVDLSAVASLLSAGNLPEAQSLLSRLAAAELEKPNGERRSISVLRAVQAVTGELEAAALDREAGNSSAATRHASTAMTVLSRATIIEGNMRDVLVAAGQTFGVGSAQPSQDAEALHAQAGPAVNGYDPTVGQALAQASLRVNGGNTRSRKSCYRYVADAVDMAVGRFLTGRHAYMAASQLASRKDLFTEISASSLTSLPAGAIVVWGKGSSDSGHISIALGDGRESSDFVGAQMTSHYGGAGARVFLPKARM